MKTKDNLCFKSFYIIFIFCLITLILSTFSVSCKNKASEDNHETSDTYIASENIKIKPETENKADSEVYDNNSSNQSAVSQLDSNNASIITMAANCGPLKLHKGNIEKLYIYENTAVGSVSYDKDKKAESTFIYALDVRNGIIIGTVEITGRCYSVDINDRYVFIWVEQGINVYDLKNSFKLTKSFPYEQNGKRVEWISNLGSFLFVENSDEKDYLIDKKTLAKKQLNIDNDEYIYCLLYPDCLIGDPSAFGNGSQSNPVIYNLKNNQVLGNIESNRISKIFAWNFQTKLLFINDKDNIEIFSCTSGNIFENLRISESEISSIISNIQNNPEYYLGGTYRLNTIRDFPLSENNAWFLNGSENAYIFDYNGKELYRLYDSEILEEFNDIIFYKNGQLLSAMHNLTQLIWEKEKPKSWIVSENPGFSQYSILWLCQNLKEYGAIYQWDYMSGSYLNYTEFTGYEVEMLSERPLVLALRNKDEGIEGDWNLVCLDASKLPFNVTCDIEIEISPEKIYENINPAEFSCILKNIPERIPVNEISYEWDFGDGTKGTGKQTTHLYKNSSNYNVSVTVRLGTSINSITEKTEVTILEAPSEIMLTAEPTKYTKDGLVFDFVCTLEDPWNFSIVEWDFGDGTNGSNATVTSHPYPQGTYTVTANAYNEDKTISLKREITIISKFPEFKVTASKLSGYTLHKVDFECVTTDNEFPESLGLTCYWKLGSDIYTNDKNGSKKLEFYNPGNYTLTLEIRDPAMRLAYQESFNIDVYPPEIYTENSGRTLISKSQIFLHNNDIEEYDIDKDGINQYWEDFTMNALNPCFELDEGEDWLKFNGMEEELPPSFFENLQDSINADMSLEDFLQGSTENYLSWEDFLNGDTENNIKENFIGFYYTMRYSHKVVNYVIISPHKSKLNQEYILFTYGICWSKDYGRYGGWPWSPHNGDVEKVVMAWKIIDDYTLELDEVFTSAHTNSDMDHSGVWPAFGERTWVCAVAGAPDEDEITGSLKFIDYSLNLDILKLFVSEDKHAIYPTKTCGEDVQLSPFEAEDVGSAGWYLYRFPCFNIGNDKEDGILNYISNIFPNERIWDGNNDGSGDFCGGLECQDNSPGNIGGSLEGIPSKLKLVLDGYFDKF